MDTSAPHPCPCPAEFIVCRGATARLFLCPGCRPTYHGGGFVAVYVDENASAQDVDRIRREASPKRIFMGPPRRCGESE